MVPAGQNSWPTVAGPPIADEQILVALDGRGVRRSTDLAGDQYSCGSARDTTEAEFACVHGFPDS